MLFNKKPVQEIVLPDKIKRSRWILFILVLAIALTAFTVALTGLLSKDPGWRTVEIKRSEADTCAGDFVFQYKLGRNGTAEYKKVQQIYSDAAEYMEGVFSLSSSALVPGNLYAVNHHPGEAVEVDPVLYRAFETMERHGSRAAFLAPVYAEYENLFQSTDDWMAESFDPDKNPDQAAYFEELLSFLGDPAHIRVELLGGSQVKLLVSDEYKAYAEQTGIEDFIDFYWMKNAFILDYFLDVFQKEGFTHGFLTSREGFSVSLGDVGEAFTTPVFDWQADAVYTAGNLSYEGVFHVVPFHDYTTRDAVGDRFYVLADGSTYTPYIDPADGRCKGSLHDLLICSRDTSTADLLLMACPLFIADQWNEALAAELAQQEGLVYCKDRTLYHSGDAAIVGLFSVNDIQYKEDSLP